MALSLSADEWASIIYKLELFAHGLASFRTWSNRKDSPSFFAGKEAKDYAALAIEYLILNEEKYDPSKSSVLTFLKWKVRSLIANDWKRPENHRTRFITSKLQGRLDSEDFKPTKDDWAYFIELYVGDQIDFDTVRTAIVAECADDQLLVDLLDALSEGMEREDIIDLLQIEPNIHDNAKKRLRRITKKVAKSFSIQEVKK